MDWVQKAKDSIAALNAGDLERGLEGYAADATFNVPALGLALKGRDEIIQTMSTFIKESEVSYELGDVVESPPFVVAFATSTGLINGARMKWGVCMVMRVEGDETVEEWVLRGDAPTPV